jgi:hypothetical protein
MALAPALAAQGGAAAHANSGSPVPLVIVTAAPVYDSLAALRGAERFPQRARLMVLRDGRLNPLVSGFAASADASVSFDGKTILFAGKKLATDPWQIWTVAVDGGVPQQVAGGDTDLIRPLWMPGGRVVYARRGPTGFGLETAALDGTGIQKLSYLPGNFIADDVLQDGRVLFESGYPLGAGDVPEMFLVYADGSGVESVRCDHPAAQGAGREHGRQMASGDIVFTHGRGLARFTSALADEAKVTAPSGGYAGDVAELPDGRWLVSVRTAGARHFSLATWKPGSAGLVSVARETAQDLVQPVVAAARATPKRHPSGLHDWKTGNLLALDARQSRSGMVKGAPVSVRVETLGAGGKPVTLGTAPVETDGSFFVQATGDEPLRFILLDAQGTVLRREQGWFWVRRGEQRICVGCHTGPERAPDNRVPQVLLRTTIPADVTGAAGSAVGGGH